MLKNYFKTAWRNLTRNKTYAVINIGGLALGLAVFIIIILFVRHELSYNDFLPGKNKIYRVLLAKKPPNANIYIQLPEPIAGDLKRLYPEVDKSVRVSGPHRDVLLKGKQKIYTDGWAEVGKNYFEIFDFQFVAGNPSKAVSEPKSVVITKGLAQKLFGRTNVMGETIVYNATKTYTVTGIIQNLPSNTHFHIKAFAYRQPFPQKSWVFKIVTAYIKLHEADQISSLRNKISGYAKNHFRGPKFMSGKNLHLILQPITDIHLFPKGRQANSSRLFYIKILLFVAALILFVACINYMNMATARSVERAQEIGIRKTLGAYRRQIISQVMVESAVTSSSALVISLTLVEIFRPFALRYFDVRFGSVFEFSWLWVGFLIALVILVGLLSGGYAALYLSSFHPIDVLKGKGSRQGKMTTKLRKVLVVVQFGISIAIVIATLLIAKQMEFVRTNRLHVQGDLVMVIQNNSSDALNNHFTAFKNELLRNYSIEAVSAGTIPNHISRKSTIEDSTGGVTHYFYFEAGYDYMKVMGLDIVIGRAFDKARDQDSTHPVIINEAAARRMNINKVKGQEIHQGKLIGIVEDFHATTMFNPIQPVIIDLMDSYRRRIRILVRLKKGEIASGINHVKAVWNEFVPAYPLHFSFLNRILDRDYKAQIRLAHIFNVFAVFAIIIACLGLFGLSAFTTERRTKEIGIRKAMGATVSNIVGLLSKDFLKLVLIGFVIAVPVALYFMNHWLQDFAYKIDIGVGIFLLAGGLALLIALVTVSWQSIRAALANPVDSLHNE